MLLTSHCVSHNSEHTLSAVCSRLFHTFAPSIFLKSMPPYRRSRALWDEARRPDAPYMAVIRAILYELQPIRFSTAVDLAGRWRARIANLSKFATQTMPSFSLTTIKFVQNMSRRNWMVVGGVLLYYVAVRIIHAYVYTE